MSISLMERPINQCLCSGLLGQIDVFVLVQLVKVNNYKLGHRSRVCSMHGILFRINSLWALQSIAYSQYQYTI
ncbi:hypothetical protein M8J76_001858 [Diaphorina citri]|nr:hypothetical protein M8J76_001858 [Diaphorina citri]